MPLQGKSFRSRAGKSGGTVRREVERSPSDARCWISGSFWGKLSFLSQYGRTVAGPRESQVSATRHRIYDAGFSGEGKRPRSCDSMLHAAQWRGG